MFVYKARGELPGVKRADSLVGLGVREEEEPHAGAADCPAVDVGASGLAQLVGILEMQIILRNCSRGFRGREPRQPFPVASNFLRNLEANAYIHIM